MIKRGRKRDMSMRRLFTAVFAGLLVAAATAAQAAPCERWYVGGDWSMTETYGQGKGIGLNIWQTQTSLRGNASLIDFSNVPRDEMTDDGDVSGTIAGTHLKFQIKWKKRPAPVTYEGEIEYEGPNWRAYGTTTDNWWPAKHWVVDKVEVSCAKAALSPDMEDGTDRPGADLDVFPLKSTPDGDVRDGSRDQPNGGFGPHVCQRACLANFNCKAWTLEWAGTAPLNLNNATRQNSICRLKRSAPASRPANERHVSGIVIGRNAEGQATTPAPSSGQIAGAGMEDNTDRPGFDWHRDELPPQRDSPAACQNACLQYRDRCRAWTYVRPGVQGLNGVCYLKHTAPAPVPNKCCISGKLPGKADGIALKVPGGLAPRSDLPAEEPPIAKPPPGAGSPGAVRQGEGIAGAVSDVENNTDRPGSDIHRFELQDANPGICQARCAKLDRCRAWTFVRPGIQGPKAVCYLKGMAPAPVANTCCVSGTVKR